MANYYKYIIHKYYIDLDYFVFSISVCLQHLYKTYKCCISFILKSFVPHQFYFIVVVVGAAAAA